MSPTMNTAIFNAHLKHLNREWYQKCNLMKIFNIPAIKKKCTIVFMIVKLFIYLPLKCEKRSIMLKEAKGKIMYSNCNGVYLII